MARMIPSEMEDDNGSFGERKVFDALKKLPREYTVFHSVRWNYRNKKNTIQWGECDFTVFHPEKGIIVIEVKSGGIEYTEGSWSYIRTDNHERYPMKNPMDQASKSKYRFIDIVNDLLNPTLNSDFREYCMVEVAVWFPSVAKRDTIGDLPLEFHDETVLLESALDKPETFINRVYEFYGGFTHTRLTEASCEKIIKTFAPHFRAMPSLKSKKEEQEDVFVRLTMEQNSLLDYLEEQRTAAIQGTAGTGKTWLAIEKAKRLSESGKVLFLCFNSFLKEFLQGLKTENIADFQNIEFYNLPQLACRKLRMQSVENDDILTFLEDHHLYDWEFKHIIIDEGQDFDDEQISKLSEIALLEDGAFYVFFDKNQFVQGREFPDWLKNSECRLVLNTNCRNTLSIANTSGKPIGVAPKIKNKSVKGDMPKFYICENNAKATDKIRSVIEQYKAGGYSSDDICILTVKTEEKSILSGIEKIGVHNISREKRTNSILFTTSRKFKGLEADVIILIDVDADIFATDDNRRLFYVGASRAKHFLDIVFVGGEEEKKLLAKNISGIDSQNYLGTIALGLNVKPI